MFSIELYFMKDTLTKWFNKKYKSTTLTLNHLDKIDYGNNNPINWRKEKCCVYNFKLSLAPINYRTPSNEMTYGDFYIRLEHKFLRNICSKKDLKKSDQIVTLEKHYEVYQKLTLI